MDLKNLDWITIAKVAGLVAGGMMVAGAAFTWSGIYNVAASKDHLGITTWIFEVVRERSIAVRSLSIEVPPLGNEGMIRLGASHYEGGCVPCHGRPDEKTNPIVTGMLPPPPNLEDVSKRRPPEEIFWIVKHGIKYTGMPAWPNPQRDDEIWAMTAFLANMPSSPSGYSDLARLTRDPVDNGEGLANGRAFTRCGRCHENEGIGTNGDHIPRLAGLSEDYLLRSLQEYARRTRASGAMEPVADLLDDSGMRGLAAYYAELRPAVKKSSAAHDPEQIRRGKAIANSGIPQQQVPACMSCHSGRQSPQFPLLAGQHAAYIAGQLRLWQKGGRGQTAYGRIMAAVARALDERQIEDVAAYLASLPSGYAQTAPLAEVGR
ncbi:cytochrome c553 [Sinorhizobium fredii]|uniref:Cytochrome c-552 n=1 Tax=Sinorhizobium fredii (strain USDA 257) TaxID=1185652 RepID=I3XCS4_SINF2|nr:c-type cytochrome [Sinorhizobium fredii]AFL53680.1 cytochrome c-552 [Sinorhizobium fredii USDA 257]